MGGVRRARVTKPVEHRDPVRAPARDLARDVARGREPEEATASLADHDLHDLEQFVLTAELPIAPPPVVRATDEAFEPPEHSDVFVCGAEGDLRPASASPAVVTLFVTGWHQVQPGSLSWVFPSMRAALAAVRTMRNAAEWCICSGEGWSDLDTARDGGAVLVEQLG